MIKNPILPGFNSDPSICRANEDYYIAVSTFEWYPGVQIYHSRDLINWELSTSVLDRISLIDLRGVDNSCGVWAPNLTYYDNKFWLIYTNVLCKELPWKDVHNYLITASDINGPWSEPVYLNSSGFDPSLFHDTDGKKYIINMLMDERPGKNRFAGIILQEYDYLNQKLIGPIKNIWKGTKLGKTEGPNIFKKDNYYYLITAEGGTGLGHSVSVARSKNLFGPYEVHPKNPILTSSNKPYIELKSAGHGNIIETNTGEYYLVHLCRRPLIDPDMNNSDDIQKAYRSILGRETAIQKIIWDNDGWPNLENGKNDPKVLVPAPKIKPYPLSKKPIHDDFNKDRFLLDFQSLREPINPSWCSLKERKGWLRIYGRAYLNSNYNQSLIAIRLKDFHCKIDTCVDFHPDHFQQMAGLIVYYDKFNYYYLRITANDNQQPILGVISSANNNIEVFDYCDLKNNDKNLFLRAEINYSKLNFLYSLDNKDWEKIPSDYNITTLSNELSSLSPYTGTYLGICCQDISGQKKFADFDFFEYFSYNDR